MDLRYQCYMLVAFWSFSFFSSFFFSWRGSVLLGYQDCTLYMNNPFCLNSPGYSFAGDDDACIVAAVWYGVSGYHGVGCFILLGFH